jgi:TldD protein
VLVENGKLVSLLHDRRSARASATGTTGSGRRESFRFQPMPRMTCTVLQNGTQSRDEIVMSVDKGILCETYTGGRVDLGAGDFEFQVKNGWLVENGKITAPIKDVSIAGNGPQMLRDISMVADDSRMDPAGWTCGKKGQNVPVSQGMPTALVSSLVVKA